MKILKIIFIIIWTLYCFIGIARNYWHYDILDWLIIALFVSIPYLIIWFSLHKKKVKTIQQTSESSRLNESTPTGRNRKKRKHIVVSIVYYFIFTGIFISIIAYNKNSNNNHSDSISSNISEIETATTLFEDFFPTEISIESQADIEEESSHTIQTSTNSDDSLMVWIVSTGKKYHKKSTCSNMKGSYQVSLKRAIAMGRGPCKKCY